MCIFCSKIRPEQIIKENDLAFAIANINPKTEGHILVITKRHVPDFFGITDEEAVAVKQLTVEMKEYLLAQDSSIIGFNIRTNVGKIAGQNIEHVHIHIVPRREGDGLSIIGG